MLFQKFPLLLIGFGDQNISALDLDYFQII